MQILVSVLPDLKRLQKEEGAPGRRKINQITRFVCLGWAIIQSTSIALFLKRILFNWNLQLAFEIVVTLTAGAMIVLWISELITEYGLGNGPSLLIFTNIASSFPNLAKTVLAESKDYLTFGSTFFIII